MHEEFFIGDRVIHKSMSCVRLAYNELHPDNQASDIDALTKVSLLDHEEGAPLVGVVVLRKGVFAPSYHFLPADEQKIRAKFARGHRPMLIAALWNGNILAAQTHHMLIDLDEAKCIDPRIRERLLMLYDALANRTA